MRMSDVEERLQKLEAYVRSREEFLRASKEHLRAHDALELELRARLDGLEEDVKALFGSVASVRVHNEKQEALALDEGSE